MQTETRIQSRKGGSGCNSIFSFQPTPVSSAPTQWDERDAALDAALRGRERDLAAGFV